ncbi:MAG: aminopeptidase [Acidobacteria bacterium]|jgi:leucyl aminopeptidase (aminopeptidase T)|nr:MAG: aminopeptidase [Acidobacteriota bacterium]
MTIPEAEQVPISRKECEKWGTRLNQISYDPEFTPGARNAVKVCLRVQPSEKVCVITDEATLEIAAAIVHELETMGVPYRSWVLEDVAERPLTGLPQSILDDLEKSQVSIFAVQAQKNELKSRMQMTEVVNRRKIRHAHMVNINRQIMLEGMRADFQKVDRLSQKVVDMVRKASTIRAKTAAGTDLTADLNPNYRWLKTSGIISAEKWGNLPGGEIFTTPGEVNGTFVIDGVVGDYLCAKFGNLEQTPLTIHMKNNRLTEAHSDNRELQADFWRYTHTDENSDRVGEFAIGTNIDLKDVIGQILQDEKYPGVHIAFGNPYGAHTGAEWDSSTHIDVVGRKFDIWVDDQQIMRDGKFLVEA